MWVRRGAEPDPAIRAAGVDPIARHRAAPDKCGAIDDNLLANSIVAMNPS
jgi:hypothetical protein